MFAAEAALSAFLEAVFTKFLSPQLWSYARFLEVDSTFEEWRKTLLGIEAVLNDAEERHIREKGVKVWLDDLKALAYDMEDVLDEFDTEAKQPKPMGGPQITMTKVQKLIPTCCSNSGSGALILNENMNRTIKRITKELEAVAKRKFDLPLREDVRGLSNATERKLQTTSSVDGSGIYGRDSDKEKIIELLLSDETTRDSKISVIPIVGMGGIGKTTLAQMIYNDERVKNHFEMGIWACVSDQFDVTRITKAVLESVTKTSYDIKNLELLQDSLKNELKGKKFFLVLDDVWNENYHNWDVLQVPFKVGAQGSAIIVTTRNEEVAYLMSTLPSHHLGELSSEECWLLFAQHAFANINSDVRRSLEPIGRKIARKCKGLPLVAKTLGGLLRSKQDSEAWNDVLNCKIWALPKEKSGILPSLRLSYHYLPTQLKRCFAYCSIFPKDYEYEKQKLVLLWMAEGLLDDSGSGETMEKVGDMCFRNLLMRSFFQQSGCDKSLYLMHELMHELSQFVSGEFCLRMEAGKHQKNPEKVRHSSYLRETYDGSEKFDFLREAYNLRTFLPLNMSFEVEACYLTHKVLVHMLPTLKCLRVLSLSHYQITDLPDSIGNLRHLRYLDISYTAIKKISESVSTLVNLQTLVLSHCYHMNELPKNMGNLINLRHLENSGTSLKGMPMEMKKLKNLQTLSAFVVGKHYGSSIRELRDLFCLGGTLSILNLENVVDAVDAREANVKDKKNLDEFVLKWKDNDNNIAVDSQNEASVLEHLQPHKKLKKLTIDCYSGSNFPDWLGEPSFTNMVFLHLSKCKNCPYLPPLGQLPNLKSLSVVHFDAVKRVGAEFFGNDSSSAKPFGSLETLMFEEMPEWEEWVPLRIQGEEFPCLQKLCIRKCPKLTRDLPCRLSSLRQLEISECRQLVVTLPTVPSICEVKLHECDNVVLESAFHLTSVSFLSASKIFNMTHLPGGQITTSSIQVGLQHLRSLVELHLCNCPRLKELAPILHMLTSLKRLEIRQCPSLYSLPEMGLPSMLERLEIGGCDILQSLPEGMTFNNAHLQELYIRNCSSLRTFPRVGSLKTLSISKCRKLEFPLPEEMAHNSYASLETFWMTNSCDSLRSFPLGFFTKLKYLNIWNCENLESLAIPEGLHHEDLTSLETLHICNCPNFVSFPQGGLPTPNLRFFRVFNCEKLKSLPHQLHTQLPSLEVMVLYKCPEVVSFPEGGLPPNLSFLEISYCNKLIACRTEWRLQRHPSLETFTIRRGFKEEDRLESFPEEGLLPSTLTSLRICNLPMKSLGKEGLRRLTSLKSLEIYSCPDIKSFPKDGLPICLSFLTINHCRRLKKGCQRDKGKEWHKIAHIPCIEIDDEVIVL